MQQTSAADVHKVYFKTTGKLYLGKYVHDNVIVHRFFPADPHQFCFLLRHFPPLFLEFAIFAYAPVCRVSDDNKIAHF